MLIANPEKENSVDPSPDWLALIAEGDKRQKMWLRLLAGDLTRRSVTPAELGAAHIAQQFERLKAEYLAAAAAAGKTEHKAEQDARWAVNSFTKSFNAITAKLGFERPVLERIAGPADMRAAERQTFVDNFGVALAAYHEKRPIDESSGEVNGFVNSWSVLTGQGVQLNQLEQFLDPANLERLADAFEAGALEAGAALQAWRTLAAYAKHLNNDPVYDDILRAARKLSKDPEIPNSTLLRLARFNAPGEFDDFMRRVRAETEIRGDGGILAIRNLFRIQAALYVLAAVFLPAKFEIINAGEFADLPGRKRTKWRPNLVLRASEQDLERVLDSTVIEPFDDYYRALEEVGAPPAALFIDPDGTCRQPPSAINSVEVLLANLGVELTLLELRDLGVSRMIWRGDSVEDMARAARLSERFFLARYKPLIDIIKELKRRGVRRP